MKSLSCVDARDRHGVSWCRQRNTPTEDEGTGLLLSFLASELLHIAFFFRDPFFSCRQNILKFFWRHSDTWQGGWAWASLLRGTLSCETSCLVVMFRLLLGGPGLACWASLCVGCLLLSPVTSLYSPKLQPPPTVSGLRWGTSGTWGDSQVLISKKW